MPESSGPRCATASVMARAAASRRFGRGHPVRVEETRYAAQINNLRPFNAPPRRHASHIFRIPPCSTPSGGARGTDGARASPSPHRYLRWGEGWGEGQVLAPACEVVCGWRMFMVPARPRAPLPLTLALSPRREERRGERGRSHPQHRAERKRTSSPHRLFAWGEGTLASPAPRERGRARCARQKAFPSARLNPFSPAAPRPRRARAGENARCRRGRSGRAPKRRSGSRSPWRPVRPDASG